MFQISWWSDIQISTALVVKNTRLYCMLNPVTVVWARSGAKIPLMWLLKSIFIHRLKRPERDSTERLRDEHRMKSTDATTTFLLDFWYIIVAVGLVQIQMNRKWGVAQLYLNVSVLSDIHPSRWIHVLLSPGESGGRGRLQGKRQAGKRSCRPLTILANGTQGTVGGGFCSFGNQINTIL